MIKTWVGKVFKSVTSVVYILTQRTLKVRMSLDIYHYNMVRRLQILSTETEQINVTNLEVLMWFIITTDIYVNRTTSKIVVTSNS